MDLTHTDETLAQVWGFKAGGRLGLGDVGRNRRASVNSAEPVLVQTLEPSTSGKGGVLKTLSAIRVELGRVHSVALSADGGLWAWGATSSSSDWGQLGLKTPKASASKASSFSSSSSSSFASSSSVTQSSLHSSAPADVSQVLTADAVALLHEPVYEETILAIASNLCFNEKSYQDGLERSLSWKRFLRAKKTKDWTALLSEKEGMKKGLEYVHEYVRERCESIVATDDQLYRHLRDGLENDEKDTRAFLEAAFLRKQQNERRKSSSAALERAILGSVAASAMANKMESVNERHADESDTNNNGEGSAKARRPVSLKQTMRMMQK